MPLALQKLSCHFVHTVEKTVERQKQAFPTTTHSHWHTTSENLFIKRTWNASRQTHFYPLLALL